LGKHEQHGAAREHGLIDALDAAQVRVIADNGDGGSGSPSRGGVVRRPEIGRRRLWRNQREINIAYARSPQTVPTSSSQRVKPVTRIVGRSGELLARSVSRVFMTASPSWLTPHVRSRR